MPGVVSQNAMTEGDYSSCIAELTTKGVVYEPLGDITLEGCELVGAIKLSAVATSFGDVKISGGHCQRKIGLLLAGRVVSRTG